MLKQRTTEMMKCVVSGQPAGIKECAVYRPFQSRNQNRSPINPPSCNETAWPDRRPFQWKQTKCGAYDLLAITAWPGLATSPPQKPKTFLCQDGGGPNEKCCRQAPPWAPPKTAPINVCPTRQSTLTVTVPGSISPRLESPRSRHAEGNLPPSLRKALQPPGSKPARPTP